MNRIFLDGRGDNAEVEVEVDKKNTKVDKLDESKEMYKKIADKQC